MIFNFNDNMSPRALEYRLFCMSLTVRVVVSRSPEKPESLPMSPEVGRYCLGNAEFFPALGLFVVLVFSSVAPDWPVDVWLLARLIDMAVKYKASKSMLKSMMSSFCPV